MVHKELIGYMILPLPFVSNWGKKKKKGMRGINDVRHKTGQASKTKHMLHYSTVKHPYFTYCYMFLCTVNLAVYMYI